MLRTPFLTDILLFQQNMKKYDHQQQQFGFDLSDIPEMNIVFDNKNQNQNQQANFNADKGIATFRPRDQKNSSEFKDIKKISITKKDLGSLGYHSWVSDEVINSYLTYLHNTHVESQIGYTNTFFYVTLKQNGNEYVSGWSIFRDYKIDTFSHFLIPITTGAHWFLVDLDFEKQAMIIYDSLSHHYNSYTKKITDFLAYLEISPLEIVYPSVPKQTTHYDCGVFLMKFATMIYENQPIEKNSFHQKDIASFRSKVKEILSKYLSSK